MDFIHAYSGAQVGEIPSSKLQVIDAKERLPRKLSPLRLLPTEHNFEGIIGESPALKRTLKQVEIVAPTDSTVLLLGETGTGKELIAHAIHNLSFRRERTLVKVNCAAIPTGLLESELFGHEKGAFTGAIAQRIGRFELADGGTVFLDEIGEIPLELQPKLLRVLQEREFERLGSTRTLRTDARLIAATNRELQKMVEQRKFREDLFYRLNVFPIDVPALRERSEDIPLLVNHFAQRFARRMNRTIETIPVETMEALTRYAWPGNIRELQNLIERAVIVSHGPVLDIPLHDLDNRIALRRDNGTDQTLEEAQRAHILAILRDPVGSRWCTRCGGTPRDKSLDTAVPLEEAWNCLDPISAELGLIPEAYARPQSMKMEYVHSKRGHFSRDALFGPFAGKFADSLRCRSKSQRSSSRFYLVADGVRISDPLLRVHLATLYGKSERHTGHARVLLDRSSALLEMTHGLIRRKVHE